MMEQINTRRDSLPLEKRTWKIILKKSETHSVRTKVDGIHEFWVQKKEMFLYVSPPIRNDSGEYTIGDREIWLEQMKLYIADLTWLLNLPYHKFWSQMVFHETSLQTVMSYLYSACWPRSLVYKYEDNEISKLVSKIHKLVYDLLKRLLNSEETEENFMSCEFWSKLLFNKELITLPNIIDICILYSKSHKNELRDILMKLFKSNKRYWLQMKDFISFVFKMLYQIERSKNESCLETIKDICANCTSRKDDASVISFDSEDSDIFDFTRCYEDYFVNSNETDDNSHLAIKEGNNGSERNISSEEELRADLRPDNARSDRRATVSGRCFRSGTDNETRPSSLLADRQLLIKCKGGDPAVDDNSDEDDYYDDQFRDIDNNNGWPSDEDRNDDDANAVWADIVRDFEGKFIKNIYLLADLYYGVCCFLSIYKPIRKFFHVHQLEFSTARFFEKTLVPLSMMLPVITGSHKHTKFEEIFNLAEYSMIKTFRVSLLSAVNATYKSGSNPIEYYIKIMEKCSKYQLFICAYNDQYNIQKDLKKLAGKYPDIKRVNTQSLIEFVNRCNKNNPKVDTKDLYSDVGNENGRSSGSVDRNSVTSKTTNRKKRAEVNERRKSSVEKGGNCSGSSDDGTADSWLRYYDSGDDDDDDDEVRCSLRDGIYDEDAIVTTETTKTNVQNNDSFGQVSNALRKTVRDKSYRNSIFVNYVQNVSETLNEQLEHDFTNELRNLELSGVLERCEISSLMNDKSKSKEETINELATLSDDEVLYRALVDDVSSDDMADLFETDKEQSAEQQDGSALNRMKYESIVQNAKKLTVSNSGTPSSNNNNWQQQRQQATSKTKKKPTENDKTATGSCCRDGSKNLPTGVEQQPVVTVNIQAENSDYVDYYANEDDDQSSQDDEWFDRISNLSVPIADKLGNQAIAYNFKHRFHRIRSSSTSSSSSSLSSTSSFRLPFGFENAERENELPSTSTQPGSGNEQQRCQNATTQSSSTTSCVVLKVGKYDDSYMEIMAMIQNVKDIFPHLGDGYIKLCLDHFKYSTDDVVTALIEGNLPKSLMDASPDLSLTMVQEEEQQEERDSNNKEKEVLTSFVDWKKNEEMHSYKNLLNNNEANREARYVRDTVALMMNNDLNCCDDHDERLDYLTGDEEETRPQDTYEMLEQELMPLNEYNIPRTHYTKRNYNGEGSDENDTTNDEGKRRPPPLNFCENPEDRRNRLNQQRSKYVPRVFYPRSSSSNTANSCKDKSKGGHNKFPSKRTGGYTDDRYKSANHTMDSSTDNASSAGPSSENRRRKEIHKARAGNHNRRNASEWKRRF